MKKESLPPELLITQRQFDIVMGQAMDNYPEESGGFLGGKDNVVQAVLPVYNQSATDRTRRFVMTSDDIQRAHEFFEKHGLGFFGSYHSHPDGLPTPSHQDITNVQKYHFIIGLKDPNKPILKAFHASGFHIDEIPVAVISNDGFTALNLGESESQIKEEVLSENMLKDDDKEGLDNMMDNLRKGDPKYTKERPNKSDSDFSTLA
ncbi:MAG: Mov34/MPN/PAD-1 family protein [Candidatus Margulisbacteria bacterium]|nr:Mov34/MPN/PAD-1 family protein [Candidatus Margulisiibacteriota bacterium]